MDQFLNGFEQWEKHCIEVGHVTVTEAYDRGLIKSLNAPEAKKYATYYGNPTGVVACCARGCDWESKPTRN